VVHSISVYLDASLEAEKQLRQDYETVRGLITEFRFEEISSAAPPTGHGVFLMANTAGQNREDKRTFSIGNQRFSVKRRAWMLRKGFVHRILEENVRYRAGGFRGREEKPS
jgi:hypothetical protein